MYLSSSGVYQLQRPVYSINSMNSVYQSYEYTNHQHVFTCEHETRFFLKLNITAHPMPTTFDLYRNGVLLQRSPSGTIDLGVDYIEFKRVCQSDDGNYTITASNSLGQGCFSFRLRGRIMLCFTYMILSKI